MTLASLTLKLLLASTIALSVVANNSAQTLRMIDLGNNKPRARSSHTLINVNGRVFMFGGFNAALPPDNDFATAGDFSPQNVFGLK